MLVQRKNLLLSLALLLQNRVDLRKRVGGDWQADGLLRECVELLIMDMLHSHDLFGLGFPEFALLFEVAEIDDVRIRFQQTNVKSILYKVGHVL